VNFLAHLYLAEDTPGALIGNLLPDLVRGVGPPSDTLDPTVRAGAERHHRVDVFTDQHPVFRESKARIRGRYGIFSGIIIDVFYDHFLSLEWSRYHPDPLPAFIEHVYRTFADHTHLMPSVMRPVTERMAAQDWLSSYGSIDGVGLILTRMSSRFRARFERDVPLAAAAVDLERHHDALRGDFSRFFPQLIAAMDGKAS
jgi:acyl carrier protein phosphodiesterase